MNVCVVGTGYVGLVTGTCLAYLGRSVICVDKDERKINLLKDGQSPIYEPGLSQMIASGQQRGHLHFTTDLAEAVRQSDVVFIAVGTPPLPSGRANLSAVEAVARSDVAAAQRIVEAELAAKDEIVAELRGQVVREIGRGDALAASLADARLPWWRRVLR